jgi:hypothetical protein
MEEINYLFRCTTVYGESTINYGLFSSECEGEIEFVSFKNRMESAGVKTFPCEIIQVKGNSFQYQESKFYLLPILQGFEYNIDGKSTNQDLLLINSNEENEEITVVYLVRGSFVCSSECVNFLPRKVIEKILENSNKKFE